MKATRMLVIPGKIDQHKHDSKSDVIPPWARIECPKVHQDRTTLHSGLHLMSSAQVGGWKFQNCTQQRRWGLGQEGDGNVGKVMPIPCVPAHALSHAKQPPSS